MNLRLLVDIRGALQRSEKFSFIVVGHCGGLLSVLGVSIFGFLAAECTAGVDWVAIDVCSLEL